MIILFTTIFFIFGLIIGSFLNVVIFRLNTEKTFGGRSACMTCGHTLSWYELFPLFSFLFLLGRCKNCKTKISWQYPLVEFIGGLIFAILFLKFQNLLFLDNAVFGLTYAYYAVAFSLLLVIAVYDLRHKIIPDSLSLILGIYTFIGLFLFDSSLFMMHLHIPSFMEFISGPLMALPFAFFFLVSKGRWMGLGDAKLCLGLGWLLGLSYLFSGLLLAFWIGAIIGVFLIILKKKGMRSEIPFAPFLVLGTLLTFIFNLHLF